MTESDRVKMTINIGGERLELEDVAFNDQNLVRDTEKDIKIFFDEYRRQRPTYTSSKILAMITYRYASRVRQLDAMLDRLSAISETCDANLDAIISDWEKVCDNPS